MNAQLPGRQRTRLPIAHVAGLDGRMLACFGNANEVEVSTLGIVEHRIVEIGIRLVPILRFKVDANLGVFENSSMTAEDNSAQQFQIVRAKLAQRPPA